MNTLEKQLTVRNHKGVHGRIATKLIKIAKKHDVRLYIIHEDELSDCSSVLDILAFALVHGATFKLRVVGKDAEKAMSAVEKLIGDRNEH
jgi:phosphotransferase system HPr (HPr) family protein